MFDKKKILFFSLIFIPYFSFSVEKTSSIKYLKTEKLDFPIFYDLALEKPFPILYQSKKSEKILLERIQTNSIDSEGLRKLKSLKTILPDGKENIFQYQLPQFEYQFSISSPPPLKHQVILLFDRSGKSIQMPLPTNEINGAYLFHLESKILLPIEDKSFSQKEKVMQFLSSFLDSAFFNKFDLDSDSWLKIYFLEDKS